MSFLKSVTLYIVTTILVSSGVYNAYSTPSYSVKSGPTSIAVPLFANDSVLVNLNQLKGAILKAKAGTVFIIKNGVYSNLKYLTLVSNSHNFSIRAETPGGVIIQGNSSLSIRGCENIQISGFLFKETTSSNCLVISNSKNIRVYNNVFKSCGSDRFGALIRLEQGAQGNDINHNTFDNNRSMGVVIALSKENDKKNINNSIDFNSFKNIPSVASVYPGKDGNGLEAIQLGQGIYGHDWELNTKIHDNIFENIIGDGSEIISVKSSKNEIYNNTFLNNKSGITLRIGDNSKIYNNYLENTTQGIRVFGYGHVIKDNYINGSISAIQLPATHLKHNDVMTKSGYYQQENVTITDNTIVNPSLEAFSIGEFASVKNNRTLMPKNSSISSNKIIITNTKSSAFKTIGDTVMKHMNVLNNNIVASKKNRKNLQLVGLMKSNRYNNPVANDNTIPKNITKYTSNDARLGARW